MIPIKVRLDKSIYRGTIMDGVLLNKESNKNVYIINDTYYLCGNNLISNKMQYKNINIKTFIDSKMVNDHIMNDTIIMVNTFYKLSEIKELVDSKFENLSFNVHIKGLVFNPPISGLRLIYLYSNSAMQGTKFTEDVENIPNIEITTNDTINTDIEIENNKIAIFEMRATEIMDVYKLYLLNKIKKNNRKIVKSKKIDIAYIPTSECSKLCKDLIEDKKKVLVECKYNNRMKKWTPINHSDAKRPNFINEIFGNSHK